MQDEGNLLAADGAHRGLPASHQVIPVKTHFAFCPGILEVKKLENRQGERAFTATAPAHQAEDFPLMDVEAKFMQDGGLAWVADGKAQG